MTPLSAPQSNPVSNSSSLSRNLENLVSKNEEQIRLRAKADAVQPQGADLARAQASKQSSDNTAQLVAQNSELQTNTGNRTPQRGSLLDVSV